jgi:hypothetical protein
MLLTPLHKMRSSRCLPSGDHGDGVLNPVPTTSLKTRLRRRPPRYLGTFCGSVSYCRMPTLCGVSCGQMAKVELRPQS